MIKRKELKGDDIGKIIAKINGHVVELQKTVGSIDKIQSIADGLRTTCKSRLDELIGFSDSLKRVLNEKINEIFEDIKKIEIDE